MNAELVEEGEQPFTGEEIDALFKRSKEVFPPASFE
jgi:hypothetical protein